ncbi:MAG: PaaI family thioesterase [Pseudomonadota bacterium]
MNDSAVQEPPRGFKEIPSLGGFSAALAPFYLRIENDSVSVGLTVAGQHANSMGICHGGALSTLADFAAATGVNVARNTHGGAPTINLTVDFIAAAKLGEWIQADVQLVTLKRRFGFASGVVSCGSGVVARFSGTFYLPDHDGLVQTTGAGDGAPEAIR